MAANTSSVPTAAAHVGNLRTIGVSVAVYLLPGWVTAALLVWQVPAVAALAATIGS